MYRMARWMLFFISWLPAIAQQSSEIWLTVKDDNLPSNFMRMRFGNYVGATYGMDSLNPTLIEKEGPPIPPGFDVRWVNIPGRMNVYGAGILYYNFRETDNWPARKDTFVLLFYDADNINANFTIKWPDAAYLSIRCDSIFMVDPTGQIAKVNMFTQDSLYFHAPGALDLPVTKLRIFKYGCKLVDGVAYTPMELPAKYSLAQNYPNPFNPSTQITFTIPKQSMVRLKIYDILGREVATLVNENKPPGEYTVQWNASNIQSGVYFCRFIAAGAIQTRKLILTK